MAINPKTGGPASPDDPDKRIELFINGTSPQVASDLEPEPEATPETEEPPPPLDGPVAGNRCRTIAKSFAAFEAAEI